MSLYEALMYTHSDSRQFLAFASRPETKMENVLRLVLDKAIAGSASDAGSGLYVFDVAAGPGAAPRAHLLTGILEASGPVPPPPVVNASRSATLLRLDGAALGLSGGASSIWIPLLEGRRQVMGVLGLASSRTRSYSDRVISQIEALAMAAVPAINRAVLREMLTSLGTSTEIIGMSMALQTLELQVKQAACFGDGPVLITGERGSGKELTAWAIHAWSRRHDRPFVPVLASAFPESLVADELFGHERHSFTGADGSRLGRFGAADRGTLFLDEVGDLPLAVQSSLMRIIDRGELPRIGRDLPLKVDVRVIAATNRDLGAAMAKGDFRPDLYDRLTAFEIRVPPLRERREDIPLLASFFLQRHCRRLGRRLWLQDEGVCGSCGATFGIGCVTPDFFAALQAYAWPGNVRELENVVASVVAHSPDNILDSHSLPPHVLQLIEPPSVARGVPGAQDLSLAGAVRRHIQHVLELTNNNQTQAAKLLRMPLSTMRNKMKRLGLALPNGGNH